MEGGREGGREMKRERNEGGCPPVGYGGGVEHGEGERLGPAGAPLPVGDGRVVRVLRATTWVFMREYIYIYIYIPFILCIMGLSRTDKMESLQDGIITM
jgi:hypothetical protein